MKKFNPKVADHAQAMIGRMLRGRRKSLGFSIAQISNAAGIRVATLSDIENGKDCKMSTFIAILGVLRYKILFEEQDIDSQPSDQITTLGNSN